MERRSLVRILAAIAILGWGAAAHASEVQWGASLDAALREAKKSGKPILIDFYADWCGWCKRLDQDVYTDDSVVRTSKQFINVKLDTDRNGRDAARQYGVRSLPTILVLDANGEVEARFRGYMPAPVFNSKLNQTIQAHRAMPGLLSRFRRSATDLDAASQLTRIYAGRGQEEQAQRTLARVAKLDPSDEKGKYARSLNSVADMYASRGNLDEAIALFRRSVKVGKRSDEISYGQLSLALCRLSRRDVSGARSELKTAIAHPRIGEKYKSDARKMLAELDNLAKQGI
ncbi:MAG: thioredoxin family protein [Capsulimonadales bacterium]|nr:thioredoxin family protein [Capsulimonadales bacterium]